jgi:hypothetical protein
MDGRVLPCDAVYASSCEFIRIYKFLVHKIEILQVE